MKVRAAVFEGGAPEVHIDTLDLDGPADHEILVRVGAAGVCHTDLSIVEGLFPLQTPLALGHEGAGVVEAVGASVTKVRPGDHVVLSFVPQCGECFWCSHDQAHLCAPGSQANVAGVQLDGTSRLTRNGELVYQMCGLGTFSEALVAQDTAVAVIPPDVPMAVAALFGCGVLTGVGAALRTASISRGDTVAVIGSGGVGLSIVQGALIAGAARVIAIDRVEGKLLQAKALGATETVNAAGVDPVEAVLELSEGRGADVAFEAIGRPETAQQAVAMTRRGGQACLVGMAGVTDTLQLSLVGDLIAGEKKILGCLYGSTNFARDVPAFLEHYRNGDLHVDDMVTRRVGLDDVNEVLQSFGSSDGVRTVVEFGDL